MHTEPAADPLAADAPDPGPRKSWVVLALTLAAQILVVLDISVVNTALPSIGRDLRLDGPDMQWVVTAYLMMSGGGLLVGGRIADLLPRKKVFLTGLAVFTVASVVSGLAGGATELIAARAAQGLSAALLTPAALSIIMTTYSGAQRRTGLALWGAIGSLGVAAGVLLGGALTTWAGWPTIFWINAPIGAAALLAGLMVIPGVRTPRVSLNQFDLAGAATVIAGLVALVYALGATEQHGWLSARVLLALTGAALSATAFLLLERRAANPLVQPHTWKVRSLVSGTVVMLGVTGILVATVFLTSIFVQTVLGYSAIRAGLAFLPFALAITAGTVLARHALALAHGTPRAIAAVGLLVVTGGAVLLAQASAGAGYATDVLPGLGAIGLGVGMVFVPVSVTALAGIPPQHAGMASGFLMTGHEIGAALGVAVLSAVASSAGSLAGAAGVVNGFPRGFLAAAGIAAALGVFAYLRMPAVKADGAAMHMHH
ncbi:DHA2 family efflux MFS transporter permease subunit [Amorphoplanes nipponensis]|uniref:MFS transporter n=1 Tax=Actinoplanes nipponensis TaxID=135950 RepID=A0A919JKF7_9ACTN|nr:MFS transporter [Actinoplanes nipponensis]GIE50980.1 MFS transporter [Actinoplanes nipponensis]